MAPGDYRIMAAGTYGGDAIEKACWPLFLQSDFPSYQTFWQQKVVRVTTRPTGMGFKSDAELVKIACGPEDISLAQLHYTLLGHLSVAYNYRKISRLEAPDFTHAMIRLSSALDVADEILGRLDQPGKYDPWDEDQGEDARGEWRKAHGRLRDIRDYRSRLVHGQMWMGIQDGQTGLLYFPRIGREKQYIDWRTLAVRSIAGDYAPGHDILEGAWRRVLQYLETNWKAVV